MSGVTQCAKSVSQSSDSRHRSAATSAANGRPGGERVAPLVERLDVAVPLAHRLAVAVAREQDAGFLVELADRRHAEGARLVVEHAGHPVAHGAHAVAQRRDVAGAVGQRELATREHVGARQHRHGGVALDQEHFQATCGGPDERDRGRGRQRGNGHSRTDSMASGRRNQAVIAKWRFARDNETVRSGERSRWSKA